MEMQSEEIASNEQTEVADEEAPAQETEASPEDAEATAAAAEETAGNDITAFATGEEEEA